jgi:hypothetical protein
MIVLRAYPTTFVQERDRGAIPQRYPKSYRFQDIERKHFIDRIEESGKTFARETTDHYRRSCGVLTSFGEHPRTD